MYVSMKDIGNVMLGAYARVASGQDNEAQKLLNSGQLVAGAHVLEASSYYPYDETLEEQLFLSADIESRAEWHDWAGAFTRCCDSYAVHSGGVVRYVNNHTERAHSALYVVYAGETWVH